MPALRLPTRLITLALFMSFVTIGCGDDDSSTPDSGDPNSVNVPIGPAGGEVALPSGGSVTIPADALSEQITIGISEVDGLPPLPSGHVRSGTALAFTPHGTTFSQPVTLRVPFVGNASLVARLEDETDTSWEILNVGTFAGGVVTFDVEGFSIYVPVRRTSGMIMLDGGSGSSGQSGSGGAGTGGTGGSGAIDAGAGTGGTSGTDADAGVITDAGVMVDAGPGCSFDLCGEDCVDTFNDVHHCGDCNTACSAGELCNDSACYCPIENQCQEQVDADAGVGATFCADLQSDRNHCGVCNTACVTGETCIAGACTPITCTGGNIRCGNDCINPQTDVTQCGGCSRGTHDDFGMLCYVEDSYCGYDCSVTYGGVLCPSAQAGYSECVDLAIDRDNCGDCGVACSESQICSDGSCAELSCSAGEVPCDGACVSGDSCGESCGENAICNQGTCACNSGTTACADGCIDTNNDDHNCGACGNMCTRGDSCVDGVCECTGTNPESCEGYCSDLDNDEYNCGACYNYCYGNEQCVAGECVLPACEAGQTRCGTNCVDTGTDESNCGGCVPPSTGGVETCYAGENCFCSDFALTECPLGGGLATCTDTNMDRTHCGACDNACASGETCVSGACQAIDCGTQTLCGNTCVDSPTCGVECEVGKGELCSGGVCYQGT